MRVTCANCGQVWRGGGNAHLCPPPGHSFAVGQTATVTATTTGGPLPAFCNECGYYHPPHKDQP